MRILLSLALLLGFTVATTAAAPNATEQLCFVTVGGQETGGCGVEGKQVDIGFEAFEPTMGSDHEGNLYFATTPALGIAAGWSASIGASFDGGDTWVDIRPNAAGVDTPPETNDPYAYVDPATGRAFAFHMGPILTCSILSWTDDKGATWDTNPVGCAPTGAWDHQTMVAARPVDGVDTIGYPNVLVSCVNAIYAAECGRSLDGGRSWLHTVPVHVNQQAASLCGAQHGHLAADEAGMIYLPTSECGTAAIVYVSRDSGFTWERNVIHPEETPFEDPAIAVDAEGVVHAVWADFTGGMLYSQSRDQAATWSDAIRVTPTGVTGKMPSIVSGDGGRIAFAFIGTDDYPEGGYAHEDEEFDGETLQFGGWITYSTNANDEDPTFTTVEATGTDPLLLGDVCSFNNRCSVIVDFIGSTVTPDGRVFGAVIDACSEDCLENEQHNSNNRTGRGRGYVISIPGLDLCDTTCPRFPVGSGEAIDAGATSKAPTAFGGSLTTTLFTSTRRPVLAPWADQRRAYNLAREAHLGS